MMMDKRGASGGEPTVHDRKWRLFKTSERRKKRNGGGEKIVGREWEFRGGGGAPWCDETPISSSDPDVTPSPAVMSAAVHGHSVIAVWLLAGGRNRPSFPLPRTPQPPWSGRVMRLVVACWDTGKSCMMDTGDVKMPSCAHALRPFHQMSSGGAQTFHLQFLWVLWGVGVGFGVFWWGQRGGSCSF